MKKKERSTAADSVRSGWPLWNRLWSRHPIESQRNKARSLRAQAQLIQCETKTIEKKAEKETRGARADVPVEIVIVAVVAQRLWFQSPAESVVGSSPCATEAPLCHKADT
ncbi:hypothetical protein TNCV_1286941 [Trichonephila clavipes]|nr:hypothetical protein TNCV_1286941 [Trichonephila clavipes]